MLKAFICSLEQSKGKLVAPSQKECDELTRKIVPLLEQAQELGRQFASKQVSRGFFPKFVGNLLDRAANFVGRSIDWSGQLFESNVEALGADPTEAELQTALSETATTVAETLAPTEIQSVIEQTVVSELKIAQVEQVQWVTEPGACQACQEQEGRGPQPIGEAAVPPLHQRCRCHLAPV